MSFVICTLYLTAAPSSQPPGFLQKLSTYIVNNIQISIGRVHLRYEDVVTNPDHPFACGVMLKHISAYTTDAKWQPAQMDNAATIIYKVLYFIFDSSRFLKVIHNKRLLLLFSGAVLLHNERSILLFNSASVTVDDFRRSFMNIPSLGSQDFICQYSRAYLISENYSYSKLCL